MTDEVGKVQPFFTSVGLGFTCDFNADIAGTIISLYLIIWGFYRQYRGCHQKAVTQKAFEKTMKRNIDFFQYLDKEDDSKTIDLAILTDQKSHDRHPLMEYLLYCIRSWPVFTQITTQERTGLIIGIKSTIECLDQIANNK